MRAIPKTLSVGPQTLRRLGATALLVALSSPVLAQTLVGIPHGPNDPGNCNYRSAAGCQDKAVFNTSTFDTWFGRWHYFSAQNSRILVDVKYDSNGDGLLDAWRWPTSKVLFDMGAGATVALGGVLANDAPTYFNPATSQLYRRVMYFVFQGPNDSAFGHVCLSYSNATADANDWTPPIAAIFSTNTQMRGLPCTIANGQVMAESLSVFHRTPSEIDLFGLNGYAPAVLGAVDVFPPQTQTFFTKQTIAAPDVIQVIGQVTPNGMFVPTIQGGSNEYFFVNLDVTYDPVASRVYLLRVTSYPFAPSRSDIPCTGVCPGGIALFPLRGQIYTMDVNGDVSQTVSTSRSWTLVADIGGSTGWSYFKAGVGCTYLPTVGFPQQDFGVDLDSLSIHKLPDGTLAKTGANVQLFLGAWKPINRKLSCIMAQSNGAQGAGGTWIDAELYQMTFAVP